MAETKNVSEEALGFTTADYRIRLVDAPDVLNEGKTKVIYAVFNRHTDVREAVTDNLAYAVASVVAAQNMLENVLAQAKQGKPVEAQVPPGLFPSQLN